MRNKCYRLSVFGYRLQPITDNRKPITLVRRREDAVPTNGRQEGWKHAGLVEAEVNEQRTSADPVAAQEAPVPAVVGVVPVVAHHEEGIRRDDQGTPVLQVGAIGPRVSAR